MAKKEEGLTYLQMPLPKTSVKAKRIFKRHWNGLNLISDIDTGMMTECHAVSSEAYPSITAFRQQEERTSFGGHIKCATSVYGVGIVVEYEDGEASVHFEDENGIFETSKLGEESSKFDTSVCAFSKLIDVENPLEGSKMYVIINPYKVAFRVSTSIDENTGKIVIDEIKSDTSWSDMPDIKEAVLFQSRLFCINDTTVFASEFNNANGWETDTPEEYNESNAWWSNVNDEAGLTKITVYGGKPIVFTGSSMFEINGTKNPFRVTEIGAYGTIAPKSVSIAAGRLVFLSEHGVMSYNGASFENISAGISKLFDADVEAKYYGACGCGIGDMYYLSLGEKFYAYNFKIGSWFDCGWDVTQDDGDIERIRFMYENSSGNLSVATKHAVYDFASASEEREWGFTTDIVTAQTCDIKHVRHVQTAFDTKGESGEIKIEAIYYSNDGTKTVTLIDKKVTGRGILRVKPRMSASWGIQFKYTCKGNLDIDALEFITEEGGVLYG